MFVACAPDCVAGGAEIDDAGAFDPFEQRRQNVVGLRGNDKSRIDGSKRMIKRIECMQGRHRIEPDHSTGKPKGHAVVEHNGDILSGGMEILHEATQHAAALGEKS